MTAPPSTASPRPDAAVPEAESEKTQGRGNGDPPQLTVTAPVYNEQEIVGELVARIDRAAAALGVSYEILLVLDGCTDLTLKRLLLLAGQGRFPALRIVELSRNFGLQSAVHACLTYARGETVVVLDGDLQDPPEMIPELVQRLWNEHLDIVYTRKRSRPEGLVARWKFSAFYLLQSLLTAQKIPRQAGNFSCLSRKAVNLLLAFPERNRYFPGLRAWLGLPSACVEYDRAPRAAGDPKQTFRRLLSLAMDGIFYFTDIPLKIILVLGMLSLLCAFGLTLDVLVQKLVTHTAILGWTSTVIAISFFAGVQLVCLGVMGLYVQRIFDEVRRRPWFVVRREWPAAAHHPHPTEESNPNPGGGHAQGE